MGDGGNIGEARVTAEDLAKTVAQLWGEFAELAPGAVLRCLLNSLHVARAHGVTGANLMIEATADARRRLAVRTSGDPGESRAIERARVMRAPGPVRKTASRWRVGRSALGWTG